ncbi:hypothetical protein AVENP_0983 [Arcobacter venerupis]|uniref:Uncharacterized protein n=1 Tax=Arcobacter venerupis TaxID=1054033 RepID=A0AAE7B744_9BACT|nr:hypothetical protein [Arcobacter venerupis]QKF66539.1 hypothetical protein AVENP_0983 [Arcobacter venerupis]RWS49722.1 hypothetical protein CKA56_08365 [Arcobacter venerupis]
MTNKRKVTSILMALTLGSVSGHYIDDIVEKYNLQTNRYPMEIEHEILSGCIGIYNESIPIDIYIKKTKICICALEETEVNYSYTSFINDNNNFFNIFELKKRECM